jgi:hypothetical protein
MDVVADIRLKKARIHAPQAEVKAAVAVEMGAAMGTFSLILGRYRWELKLAPRKKRHWMTWLLEVAEEQAHMLVWYLFDTH